MNPQEPNNPQAPLDPTVPEQPASNPEVPTVQETPVAIDPQPAPAIEPLQPEVSPVSPVEPVTVEVPAPAVESQSVVDSVQPTPEPQPIVEPVPPVAIEPQPVAPVAIEPQPPVGAQPSVGPVPPATAQPVVPTPVAPSGATPPSPLPPADGSMAFGTGPTSAPVPASNKKLIAIVAAIAGGIAVLGLIVWVLIAFVFNSIALEPYKGEGYTILVPKDYEEDEDLGSVSFVEPDSDDEDEQSQVVIGSTPTENILAYMKKDDAIEFYDDMLDEDNFTDNLGFSDDSTVTNFKKEDVTHQGFEARKVTFDVEEDGKYIGSGYILLVFGDDAFYIVTVAAHSSDAGLNKAANKILNSLEIDE